MMRREKRTIVVLLFLAAFALPAAAAPTYIEQNLMDWQRGADGSTWQEWTFDDADNPAAPENYYNPYNGNPDASFYGYDGSVAFNWYASTLGRDGVWAGDPVYVELFIPNNPADNPKKIVWFEMEYRAVEMMIPEIYLGTDYQVNQIYYDSGIERDQDGFVIDDWRTMVIGWEIYPNPVSETISFALAGTGGFVNSISVDTICLPIPAPGSLILCGIGIGLVRIVRRKKAL